MMGLIKRLVDHKTPNNEQILDELVDCITSRNISKLEELEALEDKIFTIGGKILNLKQRISYCYIDIENAYYDYDGLSLEEINKLKLLKDSISGDNRDEDNILNLIKIYSITNRELKFLKEAYEFILKGLL